MDFEIFIKKRRNNLESMGIKQLKTVEDVDKAFSKPGLNLVFVNSVCGCTLNKAIPGLKSAMEDISVDTITTVFAGQDNEATARAREYFEPEEPSSPSFFLMEKDTLLGSIHRDEIRMNDPKGVRQLILDMIKVHDS